MRRLGVGWRRSPPFASDALGFSWVVVFLPSLPVLTSFPAYPTPPPPSSPQRAFAELTFGPPHGVGAERCDETLARPTGSGNAALVEERV